LQAFDVVCKCFVDFSASVAIFLILIAGAVVFNPVYLSSAPWEKTARGARETAAAEAAPLFAYLDLASETRVSRLCAPLVIPPLPSHFPVFYRRVHVVATNSSLVAKIKRARSVRVTQHAIV
jgi:hypothetical protein